MELKPCNKCGGTDRYDPRSGRRWGDCKNCASNRSLKWAKENSKAHNTLNNNWKLENPEKVSKSNATYRKNNKQKISVASKRWQKLNRERVNEYARKWRNDNLEKSRARETVWKKANPYAVYLQNRKQSLKSRGITPEEYHIKLAEQADRCLLCGPADDLPTETLAADHCHTTGKLRNLLCARHNLGLGLFKDNVEALRRAIKYIQEWKILHSLDDQPPTGSPNT